MDDLTKKCIHDYLKFINSTLKLSPNYSIVLTKTRDQTLKTHAYYNPVENEDGKCIIKIYIKGRSLADVLRSIAHELFHHYQNNKDQLKGDIPDVGGKIENSANSAAGIIVKKFGYQYPEYKIYDISF